MSANAEAHDTNPLPEVLRTLLESVPFAAIIIDENGVMVTANDMVSELLGWEKRELSGERFDLLVPECFRATQNKRFGIYIQAPDSRPTYSGLELMLRSKDGAERPFDLAMKPMTWSGSTLMFVAINEITVQSKVEQDLRVSEERFRIAASHALDVIQEVNFEEDRMVYHHDIDELFGYEPGEFPRTVSGLAEYIHPDDLGIVESMLSEITESGRRDWSAEYRLRAADGTYRYIRDRGTMTGFLSDGTPNLGVGMAKDITAEVLQERQLQEALAEASELRDRLAAENIYLHEELLAELGGGEIVGDCQVWRHVLAQTRLVADTEATVLLLGETGTGKGLLARVAHSESSRCERPLIQVNCAALPRSLIESELFGHERGAFSGADRLRRGRFEIADRGTLFLDEVGELPLDLQAKLLQVLQTGEFQRLGSSKTLKADVRILAASNRDLSEEVDAGRFRSDLYYRLAVFPINIPPLRQRRDDIPLLAMYFLSKQNAKHQKAIRTIPGSTMDAMLNYDWPGNIRELENLVERAVIITFGEILYVDDAFLRLSTVVRRRDSRPAVGAVTPSMPGGVAASASLQDVERAHIEGVLETCDWKVKGRGNAAEQLGLKESTLRSRMKRLGITRP